MIVIPQVSVRADRVVFGDGDAIEVARTLVDQGARALQLRDIDGTVATAPSKAIWLTALLASVEVPVHFDANLVDSSAVEESARLPFASIVVGQHAIFEPLFLRWSSDLLGKRLLVEVAADGEYLYDPPKSGFGLELVEAIRTLQFQGVRHILLRDVTGLELPINRLRYICRDIGMGVTFSGLVRSLDDLRELAVVDSDHLQAVVVGEPIFDGRIRIADANRIADNS